MAASTPSAPAATFHRVLLKLSGEALSGEKDFGIDQERIDSLADELTEVHGTGVELAVVVGGDENASRGHRCSLLLAAAVRPGARFSCGVFRHEDAKRGTARLRLAFDDAAVIADDFGDQRQAEA